MCQRSACKFVHQMYFTDVLTRATVLKIIVIIEKNLGHGIPATSGSGRCPSQCPQEMFFSTF